MRKKIAMAGIGAVGGYDLVSAGRVASGRGSFTHVGFELFATVLALCCAACAHSPAALIAFRTEQQAQEHCPNDAVVWVDPQSAAYYLKTSASYGRVGAGRYACRGEAEDAGMRGMVN
jgi:hypothetical protein